MKYWFIILVILIILFSCSQHEQELEIVDFKFTAITGDILLYNDGKYNAFTDLCIYRNKYYLCFRNSGAHHPVKKEDYGKIFIYESKDGDIWNKIYEVEDSTSDLRDPKLVVDKYNRLILYCGYSKLIDNELIFQGTKAGVIDFEKKQITLQEIYKDLWLWRIAWNDEEAYSFAYRNGKVHLLKSTDGFSWFKSGNVEVEGCNESAIYFSDNKCYAIMRTVFHKTLIGCANYPYQDWVFDTIPMEIHSPAILYLNSAHVYCTGRVVDNAEKYTGLFKVTNSTADSVWYSSANADQGYPGVVYKDEQVILSYYKAGDIFLKKFIAKPIYSE